MTNKKDYAPITYNCNGATVNFPFTWKILNEESIVLTLVNASNVKTVLTLGTQYTVDYDDVGGTVTTKTTYASGNKIIVARNASLYQEKTFSTSSGFQASEIEKAFDSASINLQDMTYNIENFKETFSIEVNKTVDAMDDRVTQNTKNIQKHVEDVNVALHTATDSIDAKLATAQTYATTATTSATNAKTSETNAKTSEANAKTSETNALSYKNSASNSEANAKTYMDNAKIYQDNALIYKNSALTSASSASTSATVATQQAELAKYYSEQEHGQSDVTHSDMVALENKTRFPKYEIGNESVIYNTLLAQKRSAFDLSKFTVTGSPTITDDGIASGFSTSKCLSTTSISLGDNFEVTCKFTTSNDVSTYQGVYCPGVDRMWLVNISKNNNSKMNYYYSSDGTSWNYSDGQTTLKTNTTYWSKSKYKDGVWNCYLSTDGSNYSLDFSVTTPLYSSKQPMYIGVQRDKTTPFTNGSIDLSQFSITVDGVEVFNGNKTGIDQIKANDYTVVGSPTITDDGIASNFSSTNYMYSNISLSNNFIIKGSFTTTKKTTQSNKCLFNITNDLTASATYSVHGAIQWSTGGFIVEINNNGTFTSLIYYTGKDYNDGLEHKYKVTYSNSSINLEIDGAVVASTSYDLSTILSNSTYCVIGVNQKAGFRYYIGTIDLKDFSIRCDDKLIYRPIFKIPYTQSITGNKIVDNTYRDRVEDMYNRYGYTPYYTIDEDNEDYTLNTVENNTIVDYGDNYEQRADLTLKQWGSCTSGTAVNLLPYKDTNSYVVNTPYSAKTTSTFTPSVTGDYIAVGKVVLD